MRTETVPANAPGAPAREFLRPSKYRRLIIGDRAGREYCPQILGNRSIDDPPKTLE